MEVRPVKDGIPAGVPAPARPVAPRDSSGRFQPGGGTSELARAGGKAAGLSKQLARLLGLTDLEEGHPYAPYAAMAREWRDTHIAQLAATVGGGEVGPGPASVVSSAALQLAASRWFFDQGAAKGDAKMLGQASSLSNDSRQNLLAAHALVADEAKARRARPGKSATARAIEAIIADGES